MKPAFAALRNDLFARFASTVCVGVSVVLALAVAACGGSSGSLSTSYVRLPGADANAARAPYGVLEGYGSCGGGGVLNNHYCVNSSTGTTLLNLDRINNRYEVRYTQEQVTCSLSATDPDTVGERLNGGRYVTLSDEELLFIAEDESGVETGRVELLFETTLEEIAFCDPRNTAGGETGVFPIAYTTMR